MDAQHFRVRGRPFAKRLLCIMERCLYKLPIKGPQQEAAVKLAERWRRGVFLGFSRVSSEYLLLDDTRTNQYKLYLGIQDFKFKENNDLSI